jgi:branched-chain amino acid transport system ATP-binding protein
MLEIDDLSVGYGAIEALKGVGLHVLASSVVCLIGANGAGKTTLLRAISGLLPVRRGHIRFAGRDITGLAPEAIVRLGISHAPEGRQNFATLTVRDNLLVGAYPRRAGRRRAEVEAMVEHCFQLFPALREYQHRLAGSLSGGEQQMLAIGRVLMARPALVLLDEPSMGLAPVLVREILRRIQALPTEGTTVLLVEQNARAALRIAQYGYVLENGRIALEGEARDLVEHEDVRRAYLGRALARAAEPLQLAREETPA